MGSGLFSSSWRGSERGASLKRCWAHYIIMNCDIDDVLTFNFRGQILQWFHIRIGWTDGYETKAVWIVRMDDTYLVWHCSDVLMNAMASQITGVLIVSSTVCSGADQRKHKSSVSLAFVGGVSSKRSGNAENVSCWWRRQGFIHDI